MKNEQMYFNDRVTGAELTYIAYAVLVIIIGGTMWIMSLNSYSPTPRGVPTYNRWQTTSDQSEWPFVTRTIDGVPTVMMPEDLDR